MSEKIILYGHDACPGVPPVRAMLARSRIAYEYVNIYHDHTAREQVRTINGGNESVPTLVFPNGTTLTEPSAYQLRRALQAQGYQVPFHAFLLGNLQWIIIGVVVIYALLRFVEVI